MEHESLERICLQCKGPLNKGKKFCSKSCSNKHGHASGIRNNSHICKDWTSLKSYQERYGEEEGKFLHQSYIENLKSSNRGEKNPMYGKHDHVHGLRRVNLKRKGKTLAEIYGVEKAAKILMQTSESVSGEKNPMFGKPAPKLSGNGVKGYYKGFFFRSLLELVCMKHLESEGVKLENVEHERVRIQYTGWDGQKRTYVPDMLIKDRNVLLEVKPERLSKSKSNALKFDAAREFCEKNGLQFVIFTENSTTITREMAVSDSQVKLLHGAKQ